jgi:hypothetical protein
MSFIYPSDADRAENDQLNDACIHIEHMEEQVDKLQDASVKLIAYIIRRYHLESEDDLTCPFMRRLAAAASKTSDTAGEGR